MESVIFKSGPLVDPAEVERQQVVQELVELPGLRRRTGREPADPNYLSPRSSCRPRGEAEKFSSSLRNAQGVRALREGCCEPGDYVDLGSRRPVAREHDVLHVQELSFGDTGVNLSGGVGGCEVFGLIRDGDGN